MENIDISNIKINVDILSYNNSKLQVSFQNVGKNPLPGYHYSFRILVDNNKINDSKPKLNILDNTDLFIVNNNLKYKVIDGIGNFIISNLMKPSKIYYHSIDLELFNINLKNKINIEGDNDYKFKKIKFDSSEYESLFKNEILI